MGYVDYMGVDTLGQVSCQIRQMFDDDYIPLITGIIFTARKRSLGQGNIFRSLCQEFCSQGGGVPGQVPPDQVHPSPLGPGTPGTRDTPSQDQVHPPPRTRYIPLPGPGTPRPGPGTPSLGPGTPPWDQEDPPDQVHPQDQLHPQAQAHPLGPGTPPRTRYTLLGPGTPPP